MSPNIKYLVDSKRGVIFCKVDSLDWNLEANVYDDPKHYFKTLKGIYYMRTHPEEAAKTLIDYVKDNYDNDIDDYNQSFERN